MEVTEAKEPEKHFSGLSYKEAWGKRRMVVYLTTIFTAAYILLVSFVLDKPTDLHGTIATTLMVMDGSLIMSWIFGSVVDDKWGK